MRKRENNNPVFGHKNKKKTPHVCNPNVRSFLLYPPAFSKKLQGNREQIPEVIKSIGVSFFILHLFGIYLLPVDAAPCVENVGKHKRNQDRHVGHYPQRKLAGTTVCQRKRALQVGGRGIIGSIVITRHQQQRQYREHSACACKPYTLVERRFPHRADNSPKQMHKGKLHTQSYRAGRHYFSTRHILSPQPLRNFYPTCSGNNNLMLTHQLSICEG